MNNLIKAIISPILGIISIGLFWVPSLAETGLGIGYVITMTIAFICAISGFIWGIKGVKADMKSLAIIGILLCSIGLIGAICMFVLWLAMGGPTEINWLWKWIWE